MSRATDTVLPHFEKPTQVEDDLYRGVYNLVKESLKGLDSNRDPMIHAARVLDNIVAHAQDMRQRLRHAMVPPDQRSLFPIRQRIQYGPRRARRVTPTAFPAVPLLSRSRLRP